MYYLYPKIKADFKAVLLFGVQIYHGFLFSKKTITLVFFSKKGSGRFKRK